MIKPMLNSDGIFIVHIEISELVYIALSLRVGSVCPEFVLGYRSQCITEEKIGMFATHLLGKEILRKC